MLISIKDVFIITLLCVGIIQGIFISSALLKNSNRIGYRIADFFLTGLIFLVALECLRFLSLSLALYHYSRLGFVLIISLQQFYGPLIYFYTTYRLNPNRPFRVYDLILTIPFMVELCFYLILYTKLDFSYQQALTDRIVFFHYSTEGIILEAGFIFSMVSYLVFTSIKYRKELMSTNNLGLRRILIILFAISIGHTLVFAVDLTFFSHRLNPNWYALVTFCHVAFIFYIGYHHLRLSPSIIHLKNLKKYIASVDEENIEKIEDAKMKIEKFISEQKVYLDKNLTQNKLAETLKISPKKLSNILNKGYQMNFFDFLNTLRCKEDEFF